MSDNKLSNEASSSSDSLDNLERRKLSSSQIQKSTCKGFLKEKEKSKGKFGMETWTKYYFMVIDQYIYKLTNDTDFEVKNYFSIFNGKIVSGRGNMFSIFFPDGTQKLYSTENLIEKQKWINAILKVSSTTEKVSHESILYSLNDAGVGTDKDGIIRAVNDKALDLFGYSTKGQLINRKVAILMDASFEKMHDKFMSNYLETGNKYLIGNPRNVTAKRSDGSSFSVEISLTETTDDNMRFIAIFRPNKKNVEKYQESIDNNAHPSMKEIVNLRRELDKRLDAYIQEIDEITREEFQQLKEIINKKMESNLNKKLQIEQLTEQLQNLQEISKNLQRELDIYKQVALPTMLDILNNDRANHKFIEFCSVLKCEEMVLFWNEVETFKSSKMNLKEKGKWIFEKYLSSKTKLDVDENLILDVKKILTTPNNDLFNSIQKAIFERMEKFLHKKFCESAMGKEIVEYLQLE